MARLIDADALSLTMIGDSDMQGRYTATMGYRGQGRVLAVVYELYRRMIAEAPTVDAVPVVHGRWIWKGGCFHCTNCKTSNDHTPKYCEGCGAKMDLEVKDA